MQLQPKFYSYRSISCTKGETLVSVIIGVFVLSIVIFAIVNILNTNTTIEDDYSRNLRIRLLEQNASNIIRSMDTTAIPEK